MHNLWEFLLQTLSVSLAAGLLLVLKRLFADKLSPRWQYGIWGLLALRLLLPVGVRRYVLLPLPLWLETLKALAERRLSSAYTAPYGTMAPGSVLPLVTAAPRSLTDWLFLLYAVGVLLCLLRYLLSYCRLRRLLGRGAPVTRETEERLAAVCRRYGLKPCRAVRVEGLGSAFVCGVFRPVLALPAKGEPDEKVLLHELLHLRYGDVLQGVFWSLCRALHWCNPFLHGVFDRIGNDMESLCDQRVLERLEGEERREYGGILLSMASESYARAPGTSSLSNGGANISRRIAAIVRFRKYPRGMALVSVCIAVMLAGPLLLGAGYGDGGETLRAGNVLELERAMALTRVRRCGTPAGAMDTYAKGLMSGNGLYLAMGSPLSAQEDYHDAMLAGSGGRTLSGYDCGAEFRFATGEYRVQNLRETGGGCEALLVIRVNGYPEELGLESLDENGNVVEAGYVAVPLRVWREDGAWVAEESGERLLSTDGYSVGWDPEGDLPPLRRLWAQGRTGTVYVDTSVSCQVDNTLPSDSFFGVPGFDMSLKPDAEFSSTTVWTGVEYVCAGYGEGGGPERSAVLYLTELDGPDAGTGLSADALTGNVSGNSSDGSFWEGVTVGPDWDGRVRGAGGVSWYDTGTFPDALPAGYRVQVFWDGELVEELRVREEAAE